MLDQILKLLAAEFGPSEHTVSSLLQAASPQLREILLRIATDPNDRHQMCPRRLGIWLADNLGKPAADWKLEKRTVHNQAAWRIVEAPLESPPAPTIVAPSIADADLNFDPNASAAQMLSENLPIALRRKREIMQLPLDPTNPRQNRLVLDASIGTVNAATKVDENRLAAPRESDALERVLKRMAEHKAEEQRKKDAAEAALAKAGVVIPPVQHEPWCKGNHGPNSCDCGAVGRRREKIRRALALLPSAAPMANIIPPAAPPVGASGFNPQATYGQLHADHARQTEHPTDPKHTIEATAEEPALWPDAGPVESWCRSLQPVRPGFYPPCNCGLEDRRRSALYAKAPATKAATPVADAPAAFNFNFPDSPDGDVGERMNP